MMDLTAEHKTIICEMCGPEPEQIHKAIEADHPDWFADWWPDGYTRVKDAYRVACDMQALKRYGKPVYVYTPTAVAHFSFTA